MAMKRFLLFLFFTVGIPTVIFAYGFKITSCSCGSSLSNKYVTAVFSLVNSGGMNVFYLNTDTEQATYNLYANVTKVITLHGTCDGSGNLAVHGSTNYNDNYTLSCVSCEGNYEHSLGSTFFYSVGMLFGVGFILFLRSVMK